MTRSDQLVALVRTFVPAVVGLLLAALAKINAELGTWRVAIATVRNGPWIQVPVYASTWGFKSPLAHSLTSSDAGQR